jgi:hypothetical protein
MMRDVDAEVRHLLARERKRATNRQTRSQRIREAAARPRAAQRAREAVVKQRALELRAKVKSASPVRFLPLQPTQHQTTCPGRSDTHPHLTIGFPL